MTENKRFTSDIHRIYGDKEQIACADTMDDAEILVDLLNEQSDKITEQAIQIDFLRDENKHMRQVLEENKQLKQQLLYDGDVE